MPAGVLEPVHEAPVWRLRGTDAAAPECRIEFEVSASRIELVEPAPDARGCTETCSWNASLYTGPFPRTSRQPLDVQSVPADAGTGSD